MKLSIAIFALCLALAVASQVSPAGSARDIYNPTSSISPPNITEHEGVGGDGGGDAEGGGDDGDDDDKRGPGSSGNNGGSDASTLRNINALLGLVLLLFGIVGI
ncbi:hypothetical protein NA56DRAFT_642098 [Hyaloscypha hepaticicola]|uniref:Uncharacterized protein n=1 Tax=Hyaloscypha hepaticicola TaxID=2082293 RepID=A0A2J6QHT4_9HELO|nr:hypothetical protein NA56DRAFT_642098 [Hyaloscypha hepaticicola]